ncbi:aryl-sulfate sulfotransferase [Ferrimonas pelagia]|uniref:Aryl-sulfate sulfotransferase n=2 Tax=Ferrimonas pelagia TaxID=1177826 RepID=A0ABP9EP34_9GAMM
MPGTPFGHIVHNPHENAPLTALVTLGPKAVKSQVASAKVTVHAKPGGVPISYDVSHTTMQSEGGIPIFGLYPDYHNTFTIDWKDADGKSHSHDYKMMTPQVDMGYSQGQWAHHPTIDVKKVDPDFKDRLYFVNWTKSDGKVGVLTHNTPDGHGAFSWDGVPGFFIIDTAGDIRWYMNPYTTHDSKDYENAGYAMGMNVTDKGNMIWVQGQGWKHMNIMGRMIGEHSLPGDFSDASHEGIQIRNGNVLIRAARKNYPLADGTLVNTVRDHILEVDMNGTLVDYWDLNEILDPLRDAALLSLDAGAVCLNIDVDQAGHQATAEDLASFGRGDIHGVETGRNWAHVNSVDWDPEDDSIIISSRHQSAVIKIGRDKEVKWILSAKKGWKGELADKVLTPVDKRGRKLDCDENGKCNNTDFDFTWTQHTAYKVHEKGTFSVFDNGDGRHLEQPTFPTDKYSRSVEYKVNPKKMTVQQVWEYGKELGYEGYAPVTSITKYQADKNSMLSYFASAGLFGIGGGYGNLKMDETTGKVKSILTEHRYGEQEPAVRIDINSHAMFASGYRAQVIVIDDMIK